MNYQEEYKAKLTTATELVKRIEDNFLIGMDAGLSQADGIIMSLCERAAQTDLKGIKIQMLLDIYPYPFYADNSLFGKITGMSWFSSGGARKAINGGWADYIPNYYRDCPKLIRSNYEYDVYCASVSQMDENGNFSLATTNSYSEAMLEKSKRVYREVNKYQPYVPGSLLINIKDVDAIIENDHELAVLEPTVLDEKSILIGNYIAEQIPDGACIQLGIGAIPDAVGAALKSKHDLGIHTEMFTGSMVDLIECGAVNNSKKQIHTGKSVTTFAYGAQKIYDYFNNNPDVLVLPVDYVNDPNVICRNDNVMSINACVEVDLWGQVCSESIGSKHMSGSGGQVDYVRGATQSKGGKSFIAFESTAKGGTISKIKSTLTEGAIVTTSKNDIDYVATEYGLAHLRGEPLSVRAKNLIAVAHPDFRDELTFEAKKRGIII